MSFSPIQRFRQLADSMFRTPVLTRGRVGLALMVAIAADAVQVALGPLGWGFLDEGLDVVTMIATCCLLGFHPLLLPTFVVEFIPVVDMLPTWTGCVVLVVALRKRQAPPNNAPPPLLKQ